MDSLPPDDIAFAISAVCARLSVAWSMEGCMPGSRHAAFMAESGAPEGPPDGHDPEAPHMLRRFSPRSRHTQ